MYIYSADGIEKLDDEVRKVTKDSLVVLIVNAVYLQYISVMVVSCNVNAYPSKCCCRCVLFLDSVLI